MFSAHKDRKTVTHVYVTCKTQVIVHIDGLCQNTGQIVPPKVTVMYSDDTLMSYEELECKNKAHIRYKHKYLQN